MDPAFVGLYVSETDPAQAIDRLEPDQGRGNRRKHRARTAVKEKRFICVDEILIECKARGRRDLGNKD
jgi:hypothetical protein